MRIFFCPLFFLFFVAGRPMAGTRSPVVSSPVPVNATQLLKQMHERYAGRWYRNLVFDQETELYNNDSLKVHQTWYEAVEFPDKFRIDFGERDSGNAVIINGDSSYSFHHARLRSTTPDENPLNFLLGGMYFYTLDQTFKKIKKLGFDLDKFHADVWEGKPVFVVGAAKGELGVDQLWFDQKDRYLVRMIEFTGKDKEESIFSDQQPFGGGWCETKCRFYFNDKLAQVESYAHCRVDIPLDDSIFDPVHFKKRH